MSTAVGLDRAVEYVTKLEDFRALLESQDKGCTQNGDTVKLEKGRKFDKVYIQTVHQKIGRYMIDRNSWVIYGIKSWAQINERRTYGTLDTADQYDWSAYYGVPKAGTDSEKLHNAREEKISKQFKPRGRPRKLP
jgi:hypothetical protein